MQGTRATNYSQPNPSNAARPHDSPPNGTDDTPLAPGPGPYLRLAIVVGILLPIATVPYFLSRRRISGLQLRCEELEWKLNVLQRRLNFSVSESSSIKAGQEKMGVTVHELMRKTDVIQQRITRRIAEQSQTDQVMQTDLQRLLEEAEQIRTRISTFRAIGVSLADVAAFMHEMELQMGLQSGAERDSRGIHRLRLLALQMQNLAEKEKEKGEKPSA